MSEGLRLGLMLPVEHGGEDDVRTRFKQLLEIARVAEEAGFDYLDAPQHYLMPTSQYLHCIPTLARVAAETNRVSLCTNIIQLTLHNPVDMAEVLATLDIACDGRLVAGFGLGYNDREFGAFNVPKGQRLGRFLEALEIIKRLWTEESVTHHGEHFTLNDAQVGIKPLQSPRPPILIAASGDKMIRRSARIADALSLAGHSTLDGLVRQAEVYKTALAEQGIMEMPPHYRLMLETYVAKDMDTARRISAPYVARKYAGYASMGQDAVLPEGQHFSDDVEELARGRFVIGDVDYVTERLTTYRNALGLRELGVRMHWVGMPHKHVLESIALYGERVIPALRK
jgi:alkanesulfonate monooxygenase SsuD/methylene tetrahydromethanopterin reductase-like flavin-dependent oxidoreductase (luciferase family)